MKLTLLLTSLFLAHLGFYGVASACSPPLDPVFINIASKSDGVSFGFSVSGDYFPEPTASIRDGEAVVEGAVQSIDANSYVFTPTTPLAPGDYVLNVDTGAEVFSEPVKVEVTEFEFQLDYETSIREFPTDFNCCSTESGGCGDTCGSCLSCWPKAYEYSRLLTLSFVTTQPVIVTWRNTAEDQGGLGKKLVDDSGTAKLGFLDLDSVEVCTEVIVSSLLGEELQRQEFCVPNSEFPAIERRVPDARNEVIQCAEPPNDTEDINWKRYGDESNVGCTVGSGSMIGWLLIVALGFRRRAR